MQKITIVKSTGKLERDLEVYENFIKSSKIPTIHCERKIRKYIRENYGGEISESEVIDIFFRIIEIFYQKDNYWFVKFVVEELEKLEKEPEVYVFCLNFTTPVLLKKFISNTEEIKLVNCSELDKVNQKDEVAETKVKNKSHLEITEIRQLSVFFVSLFSDYEREKINVNLLSIINRILVYILVKKFHRQRRGVISQLCFKSLV